MPTKIVAHTFNEDPSEIATQALQHFQNAVNIFQEILEHCLKWQDTLKNIPLGDKDILVAEDLEDIESELKNFVDLFTEFKNADNDMEHFLEVLITHPLLTNRQEFYGLIRAHNLNEAELSLIQRFFLHLDDLDMGLYSNHIGALTSDVRFLETILNKYGQEKPLLEDFQLVLTMISQLNKARKTIMDKIRKINHELIYGKK